jgi:hypothetical protein
MLPRTLPDAAGPREQRRAHQGCAGVMAGHGAPAEILWESEWGAAFIVVFGTLTMRR